jgi:hypothetical protein
VKGLLEGGTFLQRAMLQGCIKCVADFSSSCGLKRYNRCGLKCCLVRSKLETCLQS